MSIDANIKVNDAAATSDNAHKAQGSNKANPISAVDGMKSDGETNSNKSRHSSESKDVVSKPVHNDPTHREVSQKEPEYGGQAGPEPTRYGDWEKNGNTTGQQAHSTDHRPRLFIHGQHRQATAVTAFATLQIAADGVAFH